MFAPVYLDHNATTPLDPRVLEAMLPWMATQHGNPSSRHEYGRAARRAIDVAREQVAAAVGAHASEVVFTSGGSEANNLFLKGVTATRNTGTLAVSSVEHPCVLKPAQWLASRGWKLALLPSDGEGRIQAGNVLASRPDVVSLMLANNETGVLQDVAGLAEAVAANNPCFHSDAVQAFGKMPLNFRALNARGVHALTVSAHKIGGPKGAAALVLDKRVELTPLIHGGGHERGLRSGTENVPAIVGFGVACELAMTDLVSESEKRLTLRECLESGLRERRAVIFGAGAERLPNTSFFAFPNLDGETLVGLLDRAGYAVASGSACSSVNPEPSHVLLAMGVAPDLARGALRVSVGHGNSQQDIEGFLAALDACIARLRGLTAMAA